MLLIVDLLSAVKKCINVYKHFKFITAFFCLPFSMLLCVMLVGFPLIFAWLLFLHCFFVSMVFLWVIHM